jgi:hypothetical protein
MIELKNVERRYKTGPTETWVPRRSDITIVQVTHSEENARYGKRILKLRDAWMTREETLAENATEVSAK